MFEVVSHILDRSNSFQVQFIPNLFHQHHRQHQILYFSFFSGWYRHDQLIKVEKSDFMIGCSREQFLPEFYPGNFTQNFGLV